MSHARLLRIDIKHSYYSNGLCGDFTLVPDAATQRLLRNHRCVFKARSTGADVFVETGGDGKPKIAFGKSTALSFELRLENPAFPLFTDSSPLSGGSDFQMTYPGGTADRFFARIDIQRDFNEASGNNIDVGFTAKSVYWFFHIISNLGGPDDDFSITGQTTPATTWKRLDGTDPIFQKLAGQYPGLKLLGFASEQKLPCRESALKNIQLSLGGNTVIESLPNPSWRNYFQTEMEANGGNVDAIFEVVKYLTNTTLTKV
jgi:hypothetical protein